RGRDLHSAYLGDRHGEPARAHLPAGSPLAPPPGPVRGRSPRRDRPLPCASPTGAHSPAIPGPSSLRLSTKALSRVTERLWHLPSNRAISAREALTPGRLGLKPLSLSLRAETQPLFGDLTR